MVIGIALTAAGGWYAYQQTPSDYTARSLVLLLPPVDTIDNATSNPFLQLGGLEVTARVLVATYSGTAFQDDIASRSPDAEVEVSMDESTQGGVVAVDVKDRGEERTMDLLDYVTDTVSERLTGLQSEVGVESKDVVGSMLLAKDTEAKPDFQLLIRVLVIVVGGGLVITGALALVLDVLLRRRRTEVVPAQSRRRRRQHAESVGEAATPTGDPDPADVTADATAAADETTASDEEGAASPAKPTGRGRRRSLHSDIPR